MHSVTIPMSLAQEFLDYLEEQDIETVEVVPIYDTYVVTVEDEDAELLDDAFETLNIGDYH